MVLPHFGLYCAQCQLVSHDSHVSQTIAYTLGSSKYDVECSRFVRVNRFFPFNRLQDVILAPPLWHICPAHYQPCTVFHFFTRHFRRKVLLSTIYCPFWTPEQKIYRFLAINRCDDSRVVINYYYAPDNSACCLLEGYGPYRRGGSTFVMTATAASNLTLGVLYKAQNELLHSYSTCAS